MDNAWDILKAHYREYGDSFGKHQLDFFFDVCAYVREAGMAERLTRA